MTENKKKSGCPNKPNRSFFTNLAIITNFIAGLSAFLKALVELIGMLQNLNII